MKVMVIMLAVHQYIGNSHGWQPELVGTLGYLKSLELKGTGFKLHRIFGVEPAPFQGILGFSVGQNAAARAQNGSKPLV